MTKLGIAVAAILALSTVSVAVWAWISMGASEISTSGYIALILGGLATLGLAGVLLALLFYSHARGYDDAAGGRRDDDQH